MSVIAMFSNNWVTMNNKKYEAVMPDLNFYNNEVILPNLNYCNDQHFHQIPCRTQQKKRKRTTFSKVQRDALEAWFAESKYPSKIKKIEFAKQLGVEENVVRNWFANRRAKYRKLNNAMGQIKLDDNVRNMIQNIVQQFDGYCPTCLLPVHYRCGEDGTWVYSRPQNDSINAESKVIEESNVLQDRMRQNDRDLNGNFKDDDAKSEDYDSLLSEVAMLCE